jgi:hypothetical protein
LHLTSRGRRLEDDHQTLNGGVVVKPGDTCTLLFVTVNGGLTITGGTRRGRHDERRRRRLKQLHGQNVGCPISHWRR